MKRWAWVRFRAARAAWARARWARRWPIYCWRIFWWNYRIERMDRIERTDLSIVSTADGARFSVETSRRG